MGGCAAFALAVFGLEALDPVLSALPANIRMFVGVAPVEEALKLLVVVIVGGMPSRWGRMTSGLVYSIAVALGFAAVENIAYTDRFGIETGLVRALTAVPGHALHSALVGVQLGRAHSARSRSAIGGVALGLLIAILAHGTYNALLLETPALRTLVVPLLLVEGALVLALFRRAREEDLSSIVEQLSMVPALANAPASSLRMLATRALKRRVAPGERLFVEGDESESVFLVLGGHMTVERFTPDPNDGDAREEVGELDRGDFFGEIGVLLDRERSASVRADGDAMVLELSRTGLHEAVAVVDGLAEELRDSASQRGIDSSQLPTVTALHAEADLREERQASDLDPESLEARLRAIPLLEGLRTEVLRLLAASAWTETRRRGSVLLREGAAGRGLCVV
ncbi:MAG: PrsW family intramembrane metalloprotease, partial [Deltaproteobacteria bacterium]|nr:PrsW family intramembrane metalloprotease [Deltaproteobacteria bacterium]